MKLLLHSLFSLCLLTGFSLCTFSQNQILSSGGDITGPGGSQSFSLGQLGYNSLSAGDFSIIEGLQQPKEISVLVSVWFEEEGIEIYPNPARNYIKLIYPDLDQERKISLFSMKGEKLRTTIIKESENLIDIKDLSPGLYFLLIQSKDKVLHAHQIIIE
ncbi:MAG: T9SS type A sorting domain-containing protein [Bacteroidia bacterium]|nr:T9SS type A sorting domain-containing protein [Bacteroidia bacterium]